MIFSPLVRYAAFLHDMKGGVSQVRLLSLLHQPESLLVHQPESKLVYQPESPRAALDSAAMADLQPADGGLLWHAIDGSQRHGQPAGGKEGGGQGEVDLGDDDQLGEIGGGI